MTPDEKYAYARSFLVHVGADTSKTFHILVARAADGIRLKPHRGPVNREGFEACDQYLAATFPGIPRERMLLGLEFAGHHGFTFAFDLARRGYQVVNVLPAHTKRSKEMEDNSPLKTDAKDAALICKLVGQGTFVRFPFLQSPFTELRLLTTQRHRLTEEENRFKNHLQGVLDLAWPEFRSLFCRIANKTPLTILTRWPLPQDLLAASSRTVEAHILKVSRGNYSRERIKRLIQTARTSIALTEGADERRLEIQGILARWRLVQQQRAEIDERLRRIVEQFPAARALMSMPEVSVTCAATILAELGTLEDYESPRQVLKFAGMNLIERSSGLLRGRIRQSKRGRPMLRKQLYLLGARWCKRYGLYYGYYQALLARNGGCKIKGVCAVARRLVPLLLAVAKSGQPFDESRWRAARHVGVA